MSQPLPTPLRLLAILFGFFLFHQIPCNATILHVAKDGDGTDGLTWATAFQSISSAIVSAVSGNQIWVKEGTYNEILTLKSGLALYGGFYGTESDSEVDLRNWNEHISTIDANGIEDFVVSISHQTGIVIDGFIITGGILQTGRGVYCGKSDCIIRNCIVENNSSGGIYCDRSEMIITSCKIRKNQGGNSGLTIGGNLNKKATLIQNCEIYNNSCPYDGGGVLCISTTCVLTNCLLHSNVMTHPLDYTDPIYGGGIYIINMARYINDTTVTLSNCTIANNSVATPSNTYEIYSIFSSCFATDAPPPKITISNSIIADPTKGYGLDNYTYTNYVPSLVSGLGNISADPKFSSTSSSDEYPYQLLPSSPCIDAGTKTNLATDVLGASRTVDIPGVGHEGINSADMGCYEYQPPTPTPTPTATPTITATPVPTPTMNPKADINEDGRVDSKDLLILEELWGREVEN